MKCQFLFFLLVFPSSLFAISIVYNFRIAEITKQPLLTEKDHRHYTITILPFDQYQKQYDNFAQNYIGSMGSVMYNCDPYHIRVDGAFSHIHEHFDHRTIFQGTQTDDILITAGRCFRATKHTAMNFSGLLGLPTHSISRLRHVDFGACQVGIGAQYDGMYTFLPDNDLLYGARYIYFIRRHAYDSSHNKYTFTIGHSVTLLIAYNKDWKKHGIEVGYAPSWQFGATITPPFATIIKETDYIRSSFYLDYEYNFLIKEMPNRLLFNISYGFDHRPKVFGNKHIVLAWIAWSINF